MAESIQSGFNRYGLLSIILAGTLFITTSTSDAAAPVNTVNNGRVIKAGTYYNTAGGKTTFINSGSGGLWVKPNTLVKGLEAGADGTPTNHGGTLHFFAPDSVVRIDGKVDVSGILNKQGQYLGNGGKIFIDSAYLHHSGQIYANGVNGGLVQIDVSSATVAPGARIEAKGLNGNGGVIAINADGLVDIGYLALLDTSGHVAGNYDGNLINIEAGAIQSQGVLRADGIVNLKGEGSRGGTIRLVASGNTNTDFIFDAFINANQRSSGDSDASPTITPYDIQRWRGTIREALGRLDGSIIIGSPSRHKPGVLLSASGSRGPIAPNNDYIQDPAPRAGDGGTILLQAMENVHNAGGQIAANGGGGLSGEKPVNGGNGGTIVALANNHILNTSSNGNLASGVDGLIQANGGGGGSLSSYLPPSREARKGANGGHGGLLAFAYNGTMRNDRMIQANGGVGGNGSHSLPLDSILNRGGNGGNGGLMVFSGDTNPTGSGTLQVNGGRGGNGGLDGKGGVIVLPDPELYASKFRSAQTTENELLTNAENLILLTRNVAGGTRTVSLLERGQNAPIRSIHDPLGTGAALDEMVLKDQFDSTNPYRNFIISSSADDLRLNMNREPVFSVPSSEINLNELNTLSVLNDGYVTNTFGWSIGDGSTTSGGRISILANGDIENGTGFDTLGKLSGGSIHFSSKGSINNFDVLVSTTLNDGTDIHGGSLMLNARQNITNFGFRFIGTNGNLIGGVQRYNANHNFANLGDLASNAFNTLNSNSSLGGCINIRAGNQFQNGNEIFDPGIIATDAMGGTQGYGGFIQVKSPTIDNNFGTAHADGSLQNGRVIMRK